MPEVKVQNLSKTFGENTVLHDVTFTIKEGEFFTLLGPSGCGKSTTLNCIAGLERPDGGSIHVDDTAFVDSSANLFKVPEERNLGMVFQSYALWPHMTIAQNLAMPLQIRKVDKKKQKTLIDDALDKVGLGDLSGRYPHQMSGGQQQRVALARALVYSPSVLLLDEPLSNLDAKLREQARAWLKLLQQDLGITTVYVTHDQEEALALSDRIAVMSKGHMVQVSPPHELYESPATAEVAAFVGRCNFLPGRVVSSDADGVVVRLHANGDQVRVTPAVVAAQAAGDEVTLAVRPERLEVVPAGTPAPPNTALVNGEVRTVSYVGSRYEYDVQLGNQHIQVETVRPGHTGAIAVSIPMDACQIYPGNTVPAEVRELDAVNA